MPAKRSNASFLGQSGTIDGLGGLRSRAGARPESGRDAEGDRRARRRTAGAYTSPAAADRRQRALGRDEQPHAQRHGESRLRRSRVRRRAVRHRSAAVAVLPREATVLPRGARAVQRAAQPDLHAAHRASPKARPSSPARSPARPSDSCRPSDDQSLSPTGHDATYYNIVRAQRDIGGAVAHRHGVHRSRRWLRLQSRRRRRRAHPVRRRVLRRRSSTRRATTRRAAS